MTNQTSATLAEMMAILFDATEVANTTCGIESPTVGAIASQIWDDYQVVPAIMGLATMDPFQYGKLALRCAGLDIAMMSNVYGTGSRRAALRADIDRALFNLRHASHGGF